MTQITKNLGLVQAIYVGVNSPSNIYMLWYNTNPGENKHYYYNTVSLAWEPIATTAPDEFLLEFSNADLVGANYTLTLNHYLNADLISVEIWNDKKNQVLGQYIPDRVDENTSTIDFGEEIQGYWYLIAKKRKNSVA